MNKKSAVYKAAEYDGGGEDQGEDGHEEEEVGGASGSAGPGSRPQSGKAPGGSSKDAEREGFKWSLAAFRRWLAVKEGKQVK